MSLPKPWFPSLSGMQWSHLRIAEMTQLSQFRPRNLELQFNARIFLVLYFQIFVKNLRILVAILTSYALLLMS